MNPELNDTIHYKYCDFARVIGAFFRHAETAFFGEQDKTKNLASDDNESAKLVLEITEN